MIGWVGLTLFGINVIANIVLITSSTLRQIYYICRRRFPGLIKKKKVKIVELHNDDKNKPLTILKDLMPPSETINRTPNNNPWIAEFERI